MNVVEFFQNIDPKEWVVAIFGGLAVLSVQKGFSDFIIPIYKGKVEKLPNFNKTEWRGYPDNNELDGEPTSTLTIRQRGNKINAKIVRDAGKGIRNFHYSGKMYGNQIVLEFFDEQGPGYIVGTMVLHIGSDLRTLRGASTFVHQDKSRVVSYFSTYKRV
ncbi:MAG: hypothetical protein ACWA49_07750 [Ruegeria sp.]